MAVISFNSDSTTLILNGRIFNDFMEGDFIELAPVNPLTEQVNGVDKNTVAINERSDGNVRDLTVRLMQGSNDDGYLNNVVSSGGVTVLTGSLKENFIKDGAGGVESWVLEGGSITDQPTQTKNSQTGNRLMEYKMRFRSAKRNI